MKNKSIFMFALIVFVACSNQANTDLTYSDFDTDENIQKLQYLKEVEWPKAYRDQDTIILHRVLAEEFEMISADGKRYDKKFEIDWISNNSVKHDSFRYEIKRLEIFDNGTAVVSGTGHIVNSDEKSTYESSNIMIYRDSHWQAISSHVSGFKSIE